MSAIFFFSYTRMLFIHSSVAAEKVCLCSWWLTQHIHTFVLFLGWMVRKRQMVTNKMKKIRKKWKKKCEIEMNRKQHQKLIVNEWIGISLCVCVYKVHMYVLNAPNITHRHIIGNVNGVFIIIIYLKYDIMSCKTAAVWLFSLNLLFICLLGFSTHSFFVFFFFFVSNTFGKDTTTEQETNQNSRQTTRQTKTNCFGKKCTISMNRKLNGV